MRISGWSSDVCSSDLYSTNVARLVTEKSCDMLHRHMALDRIAADHGRVARRQLVGHAISRLYGSHVSAVLDGHRIALSAGNNGPGFAATALGEIGRGAWREREGKYR